MSDLRDKMLAVIADVNAEVVEREELIELIAVALLTCNNLFILGKPGQAKSYSVNLFRRHITGARQFERLLSKQTDEEQLFGRIDLASIIPGSAPEALFKDDPTYQGLKAKLERATDDYAQYTDDPAKKAEMQDATERLGAYRKALTAVHHTGEPSVQTAGKIPESEIVFLDECFKANDGVLNSLLTALNERKYTNEGRTYPIPTISFFAASNELPNFNDPAERILEALYDRLQIKVVTDDIADRDKRLAVLKNKQSGHAGQVTTTITLDEIIAMQHKQNIKIFWRNYIMLNKIVVMGRLTRDPELRRTQAGTAVCSFSIACDRNYGKDEEKKTDFLDIVAWRERGEFVAKYFAKGRMIVVTEQDDYPALKSICEGREMLAYDAATEFTQRTAAELDDLLSDLGGDKGSLETLEKLEDSAQKWANDLAELLEQKKQTAEPDEKLDKALVGAANQLESKQRQAEAVARMVETQLIRQEEQTDALIGAAVNAAKGRAEETLNILSAWSDEPGNLTRCPMNTELLRRVRQSKSLVDISRYLGRFREIFAQGKKNGYAYGRGEKYSLELGNDLSKALTSELAMLATPETTPLFLQKYRTKQIKQYRRREPIFKGMGDIICCLDESSSTAGESAAWGKAVAMILLEIAADGKRRFALIHFAGSGSVQTDVFIPGEYTAEDKLRAAETFLNGGTNFETPMRQSLELMENGGFENADVVFLTDGECALSEDFIVELQAEQSARRFTVTGILLDKGKDCFDFSLKVFCQKIYRTSELTGDDIVRALVGDRI